MKVFKNSPKTHEIAHFFLIFLWGHAPPNPPSNGSQLRCSRHAASRHAASRHVYPKLQKLHRCAPLLRNPAYAPALLFCNLELATP